MTTQKTFPICTLHQVSSHVWWFTPEARTDRPSLGAVVGKNNVILLDIGASPKHTEQFLSALAAKNVAAPDYAILTHWHWDHSFGMSALKCPIIAHSETAKHIDRMMSLDYSDANLPRLVKAGHEVPFTTDHMMIELTNEEREQLQLRLPDITFNDKVVLNVGDVSCEIHHVGSDHSSDSVVAYIPEDCVLFLGDCFYYTVYEEPRHYTQEGILNLIDRLRAFDADIFIEGHSNSLLSRLELLSWFEIIQDAYSLFDQHGHDQIETVKKVLHQTHDPEDVNDFLVPIVAGLDLN